MSSEQSKTGTDELPPGVGDLHGPRYPGNLYFADMELIPTNYGNVSLDSETIWRCWNGSKQEIIDGHWEARCPCCYTKHKVDGTSDDARVELWDVVLDCCDELRWLPPSDWVEDCDICGDDHRGKYDCLAPGWRDPFPGVDNDFECAVCGWIGRGEDLQGPNGECPECDATAVKVISDE